VPWSTQLLVTSVTNDDVVRDGGFTIAWNGQEQFVKMMGRYVELTLMKATHSNE
jgi:hypothetical protein